MRLIGREAELARLAECVDDVAAGRGQAVLIEGEPGIGVSALLQAACDQAAKAGCAAFCGTGEQMRQAFPLVPLLDALDVRDTSTDPHRAQVLRALHEQGADGAVAAAGALLALVDRLCAQSPTVLAIDDLHWADEATVSVYHRLTRSAAQRALLLVGAMHLPPRRDDIKTLRRAVGRGCIIRLAPLAPAAVTDMVASLTAGRPGPGLARLVAGTVGNPLYIAELVGALERAGSLTVIDGTAEVTGGAAPASLSDAIGDRLDLMPTDVRDVVQAAAMLGVEFNVEDLAVATHRRPAALARLLADARAAGVLVEAESRLAFRHPLIRAAIYNDLPLAMRTAWHRDTARALYEAGASVEQVARQLLPAVADPDDSTMPGWVIDWLIDASVVLLAQSTPAAVELLKAATRRSQPHDFQYVLLTTRLADGLLKLGRAEEAAQLARHTLQEADEPELFTSLQLTLSRCHVITGQFDIGLAELNGALAKPGLTPRQRSLLQVRAARFQLYLGQREAAEQAARDALTWAEGLAEAEIVCMALFAMADNRAWVGDARGSLELSRRALAAADGRPDLADLHLMAQLYVGIQLIVLDQPEQAEHFLRPTHRLADRTGNRLRQEQAQAWLAALMLETGRWDDALTETDADSEVLSPHMRCQIEGVAALIALHRDKPTVARRHLLTAASYASHITGLIVGHLYRARALDLEGSGAPAEALAVLNVDEGDIQEIECWLADAVRLAVTIGDKGTAAHLTARAEALPLLGEIPHRLATALHCRGLLDADPDLLLQAADRYVAARRPLPQAQALEAAAALLAERGDTAGARQPFVAALDLYAALDAEWDITRTRARFSAYRMRPPTRRLKRPTTGWGALTAAEARVAELVAAGRSNPEIAEELVISRSTVMTHVNRILAKLQVRSRIDIIRAAAQRSQ